MDRRRPVDAHLATLRELGRKVGLVRVRCFRPFPVQDIRDAIGGAKAVGVMDRAHSFGYEGPLFTEVKGAMFNADNRLPIVGFTIGIGGRDILDSTIVDLFDRMEEVVEKGVTKEVTWIDLKGDEEEVI